MRLAAAERSARARLRQHVLSRSGPLARTLIQVTSGRRWTRLPVVDIARDAGLGDVLMMTAVLRELKRVNPRGHIRFYTNFIEVVSGLPYIDEVLPFAARPADTLMIEYTDLVPSPVHIAQLMGDRLGVRVVDARPDCVVQEDLAEAYREAWAHLPRPHVIVARRASRFTPNKDWPAESWNAMIHALSQDATVIEVGAPLAGGVANRARHHVDLRGQTSLPALIAAMAAADLYVGPVSGPMHVAAAVRKPAVVLIGGYEHPVNAHYPGNVELFTALPCAPCWLREPCPFDRACLRAIAPEDVLRATWSAWQGAGLA